MLPARGRKNVSRQIEDILASIQKGRSETRNNSEVRIRIIQNDFDEVVLNILIFSP